MDTAAVNVGGHTYLPIRYVLEAFGAEVDWEDGKVSVRSPEPAGGSGIDNIYINSDGELIFKLSNGSTINAGVVKADNVSVKDAYVSGSGDLIITLSDGTSINAGSVRTGGSFSGLSFADYSVGTKFYIAQPSGSFTTKLRYNGTDYSIAFSSIYYELTAKNSGDDAWAYGNGSTYYVPYEVTVQYQRQGRRCPCGQDHKRRVERRQRRYNLELQRHHRLRRQLLHRINPGRRHHEHMVRACGALF